MTPEEVQGSRSRLTAVEQVIARTGENTQLSRCECGCDRQTHPRHWRTRMIATPSQFSGQHEHWADRSFTFKAHSGEADAHLPRLMDQAGASTTTEANTGIEDASRNLYYLMVMSVKDKASKKLKTVQEGHDSRNGQYSTRRTSHGSEQGAPPCSPTSSVLKWKIPSRYHLMLGSSSSKVRGTVRRRCRCRVSRSREREVA